MAGKQTAKYFARSNMILGAMPLYMPVYISALNSANSLNNLRIVVIILLFLIPLKCIFFIHADN